MRRDLEVILDSTYDAMIAIDVKGIITLFNKAAEKLTKIESSYAVGKHIEKVIKNTRLIHVLRTGEFEVNRKQNLGDIKIVTNRMPVKNDLDEIIGAVAVFRDITELTAFSNQIVNLEQMKVMLTAIIKSTQDAISVVDEKGINVIVNPAYTRLTGLYEKDIIGKSARFDIAEGESIHLKVLETQNPVENTVMKVGPTKKEIVATASPIIVDGELKGSVAVLRDISDIKKMTKELDDAKQIIRKLEAKYTFDEIVGKNKLLFAAIERAKNAAKVPATVLLRGESGTGKELFAHAIHNSSARKFNQFIRVNCAAISETLLESELFGYEEGAFTGARKGGKKGLFEKAHGGTIFLDEIGDVTLNTQVKLLRVLQEREIMRVGGVKPISIDVRVIAATHKDLEEAVKEGSFREDLYYRLNVIPIEIPALRDRKDDLYSLSISCIKKLNQSYGRMVEEIDEEAIEKLKKHDWKGNVRELENIIGRAMINMEPTENIVKVSHIPKLNELDQYEEVLIEDKKDLEEVIELQKIVDETEKRYIKKILKLKNGNKTETAKVLKISLRSLYYKMEKLQIE